ncbi:MAG: hypothetical protein KJ622_12450 [Alphaproteobacteria bacterium]|nr:hypothetical protein [Alphaproteobacteria bacterium]
MQGRIVKFNETLNVGVIKADDGRKIRFVPGEIRNPNGRIVGYDVDFVQPGPCRKAADIILLTGSPWEVFANSANNHANADRRAS